MSPQPRTSAITSGYCACCFRVVLEGGGGSNGEGNRVDRTRHRPHKHPTHAYIHIHDVVVFYLSIIVTWSALSPARRRSPRAATAARSPSSSMALWLRLVCMCYVKLGASGKGCRQASCVAAPTKHTDEFQTTTNAHGHRQPGGARKGVPAEGTGVVPGLEHVGLFLFLLWGWTDGVR